MQFCALSRYKVRVVNLIFHINSEYPSLFECNLDEVVEGKAQSVERQSKNSQQNLAVFIECML